MKLFLKKNFWKIFLILKNKKNVKEIYIKTNLKIISYLYS
jgi:hypothetical protein